MLLGSINDAPIFCCTLQWYLPSGRKELCCFLGQKGCFRVRYRLQAPAGGDHAGPSLLPIQSLRILHLALLPISPLLPLLFLEATQQLVPHCTERWMFPHPPSREQVQFQQDGAAKNHEVDAEPSCHEARVNLVCTGLIFGLPASP